MREIKFRGKAVNSNNWVYGDLIHGVGSKAGKMFILPVTHIYPPGCNDLDGWNVIPETVCQFTGLVDKNGKDIYEGDIIQDRYNSLGVLLWFKVGWGIASYANGYDGVRSYTSVESFFSDEIKEWSVVGTIHDASKLLSRSDIPNS